MDVKLYIILLFCFVQYCHGFCPARPPRRCYIQWQNANDWNGVLTPARNDRFTWTDSTRDKHFAIDAVFEPLERSLNHPRYANEQLAAQVFALAYRVKYESDDPLHQGVRLDVRNRRNLPVVYNAPDGFSRIKFPDDAAGNPPVNPTILKRRRQNDMVLGDLETISTIFNQNDMPANINGNYMYMSRRPWRDAAGIDAGTQVFYDDGTRNAVHVEIRNRALHLGKTLLQALNDGDVRVTVGPREFTFSGQISARGRFRLQHYHLEGLTAVQRNYQRFGTSSNYEFCLNRYPQPCY